MGHRTADLRRIIIIAAQFILLVFLAYTFSTLGINHGAHTARGQRTSPLAQTAHACENDTAGISISVDDFFRSSDRLGAHPARESSLEIDFGQDVTKSAMVVLHMWTIQKPEGQILPHMFQPTDGIIFDTVAATSALGASSSTGAMARHGVLGQPWQGQAQPAHPVSQAEIATWTWARRQRKGKRQSQGQREGRQTAGRACSRPKCSTSRSATNATDAAAPCPTYRCQFQRRQRPVGCSAQVRCPYSVVGQREGGSATDSCSRFGGAHGIQHSPRIHSSPPRREGQDGRQEGTGENPHSAGSISDCLGRLLDAGLGRAREAVQRARLHFGALSRGRGQMAGAAEGCSCYSGEAGHGWQRTVACGRRHGRRRTTDGREDPGVREPCASTGSSAQGTATIAAQERHRCAPGAPHASQEGAFTHSQAGCQRRQRRARRAPHRRLAPWQSSVTSLFSTGMAAGLLRGQCENGPPVMGFGAWHSVSSEKDYVSPLFATLLGAAQAFEVDLQELGFSSAFSSFDPRLRPDDCYNPPQCASLSTAPVELGVTPQVHGAKSDGQSLVEPSLAAGSPRPSGSVCGDAVPETAEANCPSFPCTDVYTTDAGLCEGNCFVCCGIQGILVHTKIQPAGLTNRSRDAPRRKVRFAFDVQFWFPSENQCQLSASSLRICRGVRFRPAAANPEGCFPGFGATAQVESKKFSHSPLASTYVTPDVCLSGSDNFVDVPAGLCGTSAPPPFVLGGCSAAATVSGTWPPHSQGFVSEQPLLSLAHSQQWPLSAPLGSTTTARISAPEALRSGKNFWLSHKCSGKGP